MSRSILINDPTLRDGNHAVKHQITKEQIIAYCEAAEKAQIPIVEIGHGNGNGASSLQLGMSLVSTEEMIKTARGILKSSKLGIYTIPGFGTIKRDLDPSIELGVDVVRVGTHCTEADTAKNHIDYVTRKNLEAYGCLMMTHMASPDVLLEECKKMESYGAKGVILMDSAGALLPETVKSRVDVLVNNLSLAIGFHAHNNLGMAIANSITAVEYGATILDGTSRGFGAGAGNAQLEVLVSVLHKLKYETNIKLYDILDLSDKAEEILLQVPTVRPNSIVSGLSGVVSTFSKQVARISKHYGIDPRDLFFELGERKVVAGQEDLIIETAVNLVKRNSF